MWRWRSLWQQGTNRNFLFPSLHRQRPVDLTVNFWQLLAGPQFFLSPTGFDGFSLISPIFFSLFTTFSQLWPNQLTPYKFGHFVVLETEAPRAWRKRRQESLWSPAPGGPDPRWPFSFQRMKPEDSRLPQELLKIGSSEPSPFLRLLPWAGSSLRPAPRGTPSLAAGKGNPFSCLDVLCCVSWLKKEVTPR